MWKTIRCGGIDRNKEALEVSMRDRDREFEMKHERDKGRVLEFEVGSLDGRNGGK